MGPSESRGAGGDPEDGGGFITYRRVPIQWWLLDRWLLYGHPHWDWWHRLWLRILPYWGDPFCAAYTIVWWPFYESRLGDRRSKRSAGMLYWSGSSTHAHSTDSEALRR